MTRGYQFLYNTHTAVYFDEKVVAIGMKSTGIVRRVDDLGRVVIPIELRRTLHISEKDPMEIFVDGDKIILKKYDPACIFCGSENKVRIFREKNVCEDCVVELRGA